MAGEVRHDEARGRFELGEGEDAGFVSYTREGDSISFTHTIVPEELEGQGIGGKVVAAGLDYARQEGLKVVPLCSFVRGYIDRHPEYGDLVANG